MASGVRSMALGHLPASENDMGGSPTFKEGLLAHQGRLSEYRVNLNSDSKENVSAHVRKSKTELERWSTLIYEFQFST